MLQAKDMALKTYEWKFKGNDVHGNPVTLVGRAATVLRRQTDRGYGNTSTHCHLTGVLYCGRCSPNTPAPTPRSLTPLEFRPAASDPLERELTAAANFVCSVTSRGHQWHLTAGVNGQFNGQVHPADSNI
jgi:hypothetical protein